MKKISSSKKQEKPDALTARAAVQDFIRPFITKGDSMSFLSSANLRHESENYSAHIEGKNAVLTKLHGKAIKEEFSLKEIMRDIAMEHLHKQGMANITASTAREAYAIRDKEVKMLLRELTAKLKKHRNNFKSNNRNWGYVGDLVRIGRELQELVTFLN